MPRSLHRLLYVSVAPADADERLLQAILSSARRRNDALGISGALLHYGGHFLQVLEGEQHRVDALFERIRRDTRHADPHVVSRDDVPGRLFGDWSMRHVRAPAVPDRAVLAFLASLRRGAAGTQAALALALLQRLAAAGVPSAETPSAVPAHR
jgi:Sensors of blue-light using FAD